MLLRLAVLVDVEVPVLVVERLEVPERLRHHDGLAAGKFLQLAERHHPGLAADRQHRVLQVQAVQVESGSSLGSSASSSGLLNFSRAFLISLSSAASSMLPLQIGATTSLIVSLFQPRPIIDASARTSGMYHLPLSRPASSIAEISAGAGFFARRDRTGPGGGFSFSLSCVACPGNPRQHFFHRFVVKRRGVGVGVAVSPAVNLDMQAVGIDDRRIVRRIIQPPRSDRNIRCRGTSTDPP